MPENKMDALLKQLLGSEVVRYFPSLSPIVGGAQPALMLSQLLYWHARNGGRATLKSVDDMERETGLSPDEQVSARNRLVALGVCEVELRGVPRIWHYTINMENLADVVDSGVGWKENPLNTDKRRSNSIERKNRSMEKPFNVDGKDRPMLTEKIGQLNKELEITENKNTEKTLQARADARPPKEKTKVDLYPIALAVSEVCRLDLQANRAMIFREVKLLSASAVPPTPELIKKNYNGDPNAFWKACDWRGKRGDLPTPSSIRQTWGQWIEPGRPEPTPVTQADLDLGTSLLEAQQSIQARTQSLKGPAHATPTTR